MAEQLLRALQVSATRQPLGERPPANGVATGVPMRSVRHSERGPLGLFCSDLPWYLVREADVVSLEDVPQLFEIRLFGISRESHQWDAPQLPLDHTDDLVCRPHRVP